jgi:hypothetical protein
MRLLSLYLMRSKLLKAFSLIWLIAILPSLGIIPLLLMTEVLDPGFDVLGNLALAVLRELRGLVLPDPAPEFSHLSFYMLAPKAVWVMIMAVVFSVSGVFLYYWCRVITRRAA